MNRKYLRPKDEIKSSLKVSTIEGSWWAVMYGTVETYFSAFFEHLRYSSYEISVLMTFPVFFGAIFQNLSQNFHKILKSRKRLITILKLMQTLTIPIIFYVGYSGGNYLLLISFICIYYAIAISQMAPWTSWMGYLVPGRLRGKYFGNRSQVVRVFMLISSLIAGSILNAYNNNEAMTGFAIIFLVGMLANIGSTFYITKQFEPSEDVIDENVVIGNEDSLEHKLKKFIAYDSISEFAFSISGPLMMIYWIRDLNFSYIEIAVLLNVSQLVGLFSLRYWGSKIDQNGTISTIRWSSLAIGIFPLFWILILFLPAQLRLASSLVVASLAALMFSGRALAMDNRLYEHMNGKNMIKTTSRRVFYKGLFIFVGGFLGGTLTRTEFIDLGQHAFFNNHIHIVFATSAVFRILVWGLYLGKSKIKI